MLYNFPVLNRLLDSLRNPPEVLTRLQGIDGLCVVGGFLRDACWEKPTKDIDLIAPEPLAPTLQAIAQALGSQPFELGTRFGTHRIVHEEWELDLSPCDPAGIEADILRRDYTINALIYPLDCLGQRASLEHLVLHPQTEEDILLGQLRLVSAQAITNDPLRIVRGYRLAATLTVRPTNETRSVWQQQADLTLSPAPERIHEELLRWFGAGRQFLDSLNWSAVDGVLWQLFPALRATQGCTQNEYHHLDVFDHTMLCLDSLNKLRAELPIELEPYTDQFAAAWDHPVSGTATAGGLTRLALLLHDIGKPATREVQPDGKVSFHRHQEVGEELSGPLLERLKFANDELDFVLLQIREHLRLGFYSDANPLPPKLIYRYIRRLGDAMPTALLHSIADCMGTGGALAEGALKQHIDGAAQIMEHYVSQDAIAKPPVLLDGHAIMQLLNIPPGRQVGELKEALLEATAAGEVASVSDAKAFVLAASSAINES